VEPQKLEKVEQTLKEQANAGFCPISFPSKMLTLNKRTGSEKQGTV